MTKELTVMVDDEVYAGLHTVVGQRRISRFLNDLARPHVTKRELAEACRALVTDQERERKAAEWVDKHLLIYLDLASGKCCRD